MRRPAVAYVRVSTGAQRDDGWGLPSQRQAVREYAKAHDLRIVRIYEDAGVSGQKDVAERPGLAGALAACEAHEAEVLVVPKLDRLARDLLIQEVVIQRLGRAGVEVLSVAEPDIDGDHTRTLVRQVLGAIAQYERAVIRARTAAGRAQKAAAGGYAGGRPPYGMRAVDGELRPDPAEQAVVERVRAMRAEGRSLREIAAVLDAEGVRTKDGRTWHPYAVARLLRAA